MASVDTLIWNGDGDTMADLYGAACEGDRDAVEALVVEFSPAVWRIVRGYRLDEATAKDVHQTVFLRLFEHLNKIGAGESAPLRDPGAIRGWLAVVARNEATNVFRTRTRLVPMEINESALTTAPDPGEDVEAEERRRAVWRAFQHISDRCRHLLSLLMMDPPLQYQEIAKALDRPVGSIGPTRRRCIEELQSAM